MTFGLVKGSSPTNNLYYGVSMQSSLPRLHLVLRSQTTAKAVWPHETTLIIVLPFVARSIEHSTVSHIVLRTDHFSDKSGMLARD